MVHFIHNTGDYFASNYFDDDFSKKVIEKSGYSKEGQKQLQQRIADLKRPYRKLKERFIENNLRTKDKIKLSHDFHTLVLKALGYEADHTHYDQLFEIDEKSVLPIRHILPRDGQPQVMVMEMQPLIKLGDEEPEGLFEQQYTVENDDKLTTEAIRAQKYHRSQWEDIFRVPEGVSLSPMIINKAVSQLFLLPQHRRPKFILMCAGNQYFLLESEKWFRGSYLQLDLEALFDDAAKSKDYYTVFYLLLSREFLAPDAEIVLLDQLDEDAHKAAYEVTKDLKEGVIHAVERLANEAVYYLNKQGVAYSEIDASWLKDDCLNMVYRLLFLFYAESREDLDILPSNDDTYNRGYSLEMLRDLEQVPLVTESGKNGYFFHRSLFQLFNLLSHGFREKDGESRSFRIRHLDSPMFEESQLHYLNRVQIRNYIWQDVICELSLSKKLKKKNRGRISYANLGINQLGSVYESLLAFRGFLAEDDYIEVHRKRKKGETSEKVVRTDGSYLVPRPRMADFDEGEVYKEEKADGTEELKIIPKGTFIYRLSGRDRQKSASYYTPEVLTQTTVKYTLKPILERLNKGEMQALDLLNLKILEPAMGAAAFHNEVINQLAEAYLRHRQVELKRRVEPDKFQEELQKIKAYIALNNVYGVDLNPTAIELGKLSLWLNVIHKDMQTPFFGYRLGVGNAVVGAWLKVFRHKDFSFEPKGAKGWIKKEWWNVAPKHLKFGKKGILRRDDEIYHFLLPDPGMVSSAGIKLLKEAYPVPAKRVTEWRKEFCSPVRGDEYRRLQRIARAVDKLLLEHYKIQKDITLITESNTSYFGNPNQDTLEFFHILNYEQKDKFARERLQPNAPYYKLKQIMDYWCSLWFWDVRDAAHLPTRTQWYDDLEQILNINLAEENQPTEEEEENIVRDYRKDKKQVEKQLVEALRQSTQSLFTNERSTLVKKYADQYRFFHYELEFIEVFRENNGFDIAVGNPPWISIAFDETGALSEFYPEVYVKGLSSPDVKAFAEKVLPFNKNLKKKYLDENVDSESTKQFLKGIQNYPLLAGQRNNLFKCIISNGLDWINESGIMGLIHPEGIYDDPDAYTLRTEIYPRLLFHFHFKNELLLFSEIDHQNYFSINIYQGCKGVINFYSLSNLYNPSTIEACFTHSGIGLAQGKKIRNPEKNKFEWNIHPHKDRIIRYTDKELQILSSIFENGIKFNGVKLVNLQTIQTLDILDCFKNLPLKIKDIDVFITDGFNQTTAVRDGLVRKETDYGNIEDCNLVYSGPHFFVSSPLNKTPRKECNHNSEYDIINLSTIEDNFNFRTNFQILKYPSLNNDWISSYKLIFRKMIPDGERSLISCIVPPNSTHMNSCISITFKEHKELLEFASLSVSIPYEFYFRTLSKENLYENTISDFPFGINKKYLPFLESRILQLNCLTKHYSELWESSFDKIYSFDNWSSEDERLKPFYTLTQKWTWNTPLRSFFERRMALVEIDVIVAMALGISLKELIMMYTIEFPVMQQYEENTWYDTKGNIVFTNSSGLVGVGLDRPDWEKIKDLPAGETYEHTITKSELYYGEKVTYYAPFTKCDRVEDYKRAWAHFEKRFKEQ